MKNTTTYTVLSLIIAVALLSAGVYFATQAPMATAENVSISNGQQYVDITAKGKYTPQLSSAKAGMPTVIRVKTNGTFDCTSQLTVPAIGYRQVLPPTGSTEITLAAQQSGATVRGVCGMGMYNFEIKFM